MAHFKLIAALVVVLFAIVLQAEARKSLWRIVKEMQKSMNEKLSPKDQADAEKVYSFMEKYMSELELRYAIRASKLVIAWDQVLHHPDQCNELSLGYIATVTEYMPFFTMSSFPEAAGVYANRCLTQDYLMDKVKLRAGYYSNNSFMAKLAFVNEQFMADYFLENPQSRELMTILPSKSSSAIAKAIIREFGQKAEEMKNEIRVRAYLDERLYMPCFNYENSLRDIIEQIEKASWRLEGGWRASQKRMFASLDKDSEKIFFRYSLCRATYAWKQKHLLDAEVVSELKRLARS